MPGYPQPPTQRVSQSPFGALLGNTRTVATGTAATTMRWRGEVEFQWENFTYNITHYNGYISISHSRRQETELLCKTADEVLEYRVGTSRLRDVITQVLVTDRTI
ncbi:MAG: hypothetical protein IJA11_06830 [Oscillospiraceae bacterium]|nr:hypothetical protein [Oscillospiraceae bacterium]